MILGVMWSKIKLIDTQLANFNGGYAICSVHYK